MSVLTAYNLVRDKFKFWQSEDWQAGLTEVIALPNMNVVKRLLLRLTVNLTTEHTFVPYTNEPEDSIMQIARRIRIEVANEAEIVNLPFVHLWFKTCLERSCVSFIEPFPTAIDTTATISAFCEIDFSDYQDFGLDAELMDQIRMTIEWGDGDSLGTLVTINNANLKIWYDERQPSDNFYINPLVITDFFNEQLSTITDDRIDLPKGKRIPRIILRLFDGSVPIPFTDANLTRLVFEYNGNPIWGPVTGLEGFRFWKQQHGFECNSFANAMWCCGWLGLHPPCFYHQLDESYLVVDFREIIGRQMTHSINTNSSDTFSLIYSFNAAGLVNPNMGIYIDSVFTAEDRLMNMGSKVSRSLPSPVRAQLLETAKISKAPYVKASKLISRNQGDKDIANIFASTKATTTRVIGTGKKIFKVNSL
jgi:hypothetical protein